MFKLASSWYWPQVGTPSDGPTCIGIPPSHRQAHPQSDGPTWAYILKARMNIYTLQLWRHISKWVLNMWHKEYIHDALGQTLCWAIIIDWYRDELQLYTYVHRCWKGFDREGGHLGLICWWFGWSHLLSFMHTILSILIKWNEMSFRESG